MLIPTLVKLFSLEQSTVDKVWVNHISVACCLPLQELYNQALHTIYNICNLNSSNLTCAAQYGIIPFIHSTFTSQYALKE